LTDLLSSLYSTDVNYIASQAILRSQAGKAGLQASNGTGANEAEDADDASDQAASADAMASLDMQSQKLRQARAPVGFVAASSGPQNGNDGQHSMPPPPLPPVTNPDVIEIDVDRDDDDG
jgi:pre-mRNA-splicing factor SYF1